MNPRTSRSCSPSSGTRGTSCTVPCSRPWSTGGVPVADVTTLERIDATGTAGVIELLVLFGLLGFPLLAGALRRSRSVPRWIPVVLLAGVVSFFFPVSEGIGATLMWVAFVDPAVPDGSLARQGGGPPSRRPSGAPARHGPGLRPWAPP